MHRRRVLATEIADVSVLNRREFRGEYGYGMRFGAGGLWGGFGLLFTKKGALSMYVSRTDGYVLVHLVGGRPMLLTPTNPHRFAAALSLARGQPNG